MTEKNNVVLEAVARDALLRAVGKGSACACGWKLPMRIVVVARQEASVRNESLRFEVGCPNCGNVVLMRYA